MQNCALNANSITFVHVIINYMPYMYHMEEAIGLKGFFFPLSVVGLLFSPSLIHN